MYVMHISKPKINLIPMKNWKIYQTLLYRIHLLFTLLHMTGVLYRLCCIVCVVLYVTNAVDWVRVLYSSFMHTYLQHSGILNTAQAKLTALFSTISN